MFVCRVCGKEFSKKRNARRHEDLVHGSKGESCLGCGRPCKGKESLRKHHTTCPGRRAATPAAAERRVTEEELTPAAAGRVEKEELTPPAAGVDTPILPELVDSATTNVVSYVGGVGDVIPWTAERSLLLLAPAAVCGVLVPSQWPRPLSQALLGMDAGILRELQGRQYPLLEECRQMMAESQERVRAAGQQAAGEMDIPGEEADADWGSDPFSDVSDEFGQGMCTEADLMDVA